MRRREFIATFGGAVSVWPITARAQQSTPPVVALINGGAPDASAPYAAAFRKGLSDTIQIAATQNVRYWHKADIPTGSVNVHFWG